MVTPELTNELVQRWLDGGCLIGSDGNGPYAHNDPEGDAILFRLEDLARQILATMQREERLRKALRFYAKRDIYRIDGDPGYSFSKAECDGGEIARLALAHHRNE